MEHLIYDKLFDFLVRYGILFKSQYGFRKGHSTTHAILDFLKQVTEAQEQGDECMGIFCDLSKAFDTINHELLLHKLQHYGITGQVMNGLDLIYLIGSNMWNIINLSQDFYLYKLVCPKGVFLALCYF
jgi:hypothetical protein